jgi:hypothetical protein
MISWKPWGVTKRIDLNEPQVVMDYGRPVPGERCPR